MSDKLQEVDAITVQAWVSEGRAQLFDIREADEFFREHIEAAALVPQARFDSRTGDTHRNDDSEIAVFYCNSGQRTRAAAAAITRCGFREVYAMKGGLAGWKGAGFNTKVNRQAPISLQRQVQITAGSMVVAGLLLAWLLSPWFALISGFVGLGLVFAGVTNTCALARLLALLPYNRRDAPQDSALPAASIEG